MINIQDLPVEVLNHVLSFIEYEPYAKQPDGAAKTEGHKFETDDRDDDDDDDDADIGFDEYESLRNICLVSRMFRELAQPLIFRHFDDDGLTADLGGTISFTAALYRNPKLGKHVQSISIATVPFAMARSNGLDAEHSKLFTRAIKELRLADQEKAWIGAMKKKDLTVLVALMVNKTPNVRDMELPGDQISTKPFVDLFSRNPSILSKLEDLWISCDDEIPGYSISSYEQFLTLGKLTAPTFEFGDLDDASFPSTWTPGTLATQTVIFDKCHIDAGAIEKFMRACKKLTSFAYDAFNEDDPFFRRTPRNKAATEFNAAQVQQAARLHKDSLESFNLGFARDSTRPSTQVKIGSFRDFSVLETITISHAVLPPHPQFPSSLQTLYVTDCLVSIRDMAQNIANDCKNGLYPHFTEFKVITVDVTLPIKLAGQIIPEGQTPEQCFVSLRDMFKGTNVDFQIASYRKPGIDDVYDDDDSNYTEDLEYEYGQMISAHLTPLDRLFLDRENAPAQPYPY
jgi:hypothetical protein